MQVSEINFRENADFLTWAVEDAEVGNKQSFIVKIGLVIQNSNYCT